MMNLALKRTKCSAAHQRDDGDKSLDVRSGIEIDPCGQDQDFSAQ
jgi:hypothetical protein